MPRMEFEPTNPVFYEAKILRASDRSATVIGRRYHYERKSLISSLRLHGKPEY
jgi:hypothetical protein